MEEKKPSSAISDSETFISKDLPSESLSRVDNLIKGDGVFKPIPPDYDTQGSYSDLVRGLLKISSVQRGKISCFLSIKPAFTNMYGGLHGGAVAAVAEIVSIACARTVVGEDKDLFLGELGLSYLSGAPRNAEVVVDGSVVRSGRNLTAVTVEFRLKESGRLLYTTRATFYNMPVASL
ncbi:unnamed protein product [Ilex paraguariensis]|uniref:Thioesterase domain-containing protein n=1 Tax=Ilex paraguariensis TaxID=185542 RepID=A0ABC8UGA7_9AQUA